MISKHVYRGRRTLCRAKRQGTYRYERRTQSRQFLFQHLRGQTQEKLSERDEPEGIGPVPNLRGRRWGKGRVPERPQSRVQGRQTIHGLNAARERIPEQIGRLHHL